MKTIMMVFALVLVVSAVSFATEQKNQSTSADTVEVVTVDSVNYYAVTVTFRGKNVSLTRTSAEAIALGRIARHIYGPNDTAVEHAMGGGLAHKCEFSQPKLQSNGRFEVTATVYVPVPEK